MPTSAAEQPDSAWAEAAAWARSGVMGLGGWPDGPPVLPPWGLPQRLDDLVRDIEQQSAASGPAVRVSWAAALGGRAALLDLARAGRISANGSCRLLRASDGWVALNLARAGDRDLVEALSGRDVTDPWRDAADHAARATADDFVARARLLGLGAARLPGPDIQIGTDPWTIVDRCHRGGDSADAPWMVVDLSSLWAGPVAAHVLGAAGAQVIKIESPARPDGARSSPAFYRWVHRSDEVTESIDLRGSGRQRAATLIDEADVVIEGSRPRALEQLGLGPADRVGKPGQVWLSITGYGRATTERDWVAFGDDAAVAGGLVGWDQTGDPVFLGDAIADPLTGLVGALAVLRARKAGGGQLIDVAMSRVAAAMALGSGGPPAGRQMAAIVERDGAGGWQVRVGNAAERVRTQPPTFEWVSARRQSLPR